MSKSLVKHLEKQFNISITQQDYVEEKKLHLFTDGFLFILASKERTVQDLTSDFVSFKTMVALSWKYAQNIEELPSTDTRADNVFAEVITNLKGTVTEPIITQEASGKYKDYFWLAYTNSAML